MTTDRDTKRRVRSWLQADQHESADRVLQAVLDAVDTTQQRRATRWPAWRFPRTITASRFGLASALVVVAALVGLNVVAPLANVPLPALGGPPATTAPAEANRHLVYELDGVIYLADADGSDPTRVGVGYLNPTTATGSVWSPDGRHFIYYGDGTTQISDADGRVVAEGGPSGGGYWSPDSARLQAWTSNRTRLAVYGIDGVLQASLALPEGYHRAYDTEGVWAPDGRSVLVRILQSDRSEAWELPIDGSAPRRLADDHPFARESGAFSRDGRRVAYVIQVQPPEAPASQLVVANADGRDARTVVQPEPNYVPGFTLAWSPDGERLAYIRSGNLVVLEVATGTISTAVPGFGPGYLPFSWSSASDKLLFAAPGDGGDTSLWSVNVDGTGRTLLVAGATWGAMPPASATGASGDPPREVVDATLSPASTPSDAGVRPGASLIRIAGHEVSVVLPAAVAGQVPADGDAGNGISWRNHDERNGIGSRWMAWRLYAPGGINDPSGDTFMLPLPDEPVAWLRQLPELTVLAERDIGIGGQPARLLDVSSPGNDGTFMYEVPVGDSGATSGFVVAGGAHTRYAIWQLGETWMVAQGLAVGISALETADAPGDPFMQFIADLRFP